MLVRSVRYSKLVQSSCEKSIHENCIGTWTASQKNQKQGQDYSSLTWIWTPASSLYCSHSCEISKTHLHLLKSEFVSTGLTHFPVEIFLFVQQLLRAVVMLVNAGIFLKHTASYCPPQLCKPDEDGEKCIIPQNVVM